MQVLSLSQASRQVSDLKDYLTIGVTPNEEQCTPAGDSLELQLLECKTLANQIERREGKPPRGAEFFILRNEHEFGTYHELAIWFEPRRPEEENSSPSEDYAFRIEITPEHWDRTALEMLKRSGHPSYRTKKTA